MFVSVIIPTYNDWRRLSLCLKALEEQSYPAERFEIIVVNNNPADTVPVGFHIPDNCQILTESKVGSYAARNKGLEHSSGNLLAFTDSDCIPDKDWIANGVDFLNRNPEFTRIAGKIELFYRSKELTDAELYEKVYAFKQDFAASLGVSVTGNMFAYKYIFEQIGGFNDALFSGGDSEWSLRAQKAGFRISFGKDVIINHPARHDMAELVKKARRTAGLNGQSKMKAFFRFFKYAIPPVHTLFHGVGLSVSERVRIFMIRYKLNIIRSVEEVKLSFGKVASRE